MCTKIPQNTRSTASNTKVAARAIVNTVQVSIARAISERFSQIFVIDKVTRTLNLTIGNHMSVMTSTLSQELQESAKIKAVAAPVAMTTTVRRLSTMMTVADPA